MNADSGIYVCETNHHTYAYISYLIVHIIQGRKRFFLYFCMLFLSCKPGKAEE